MKKIFTNIISVIALPLVLFGIIMVALGMAALLSYNSSESTAERKVGIFYKEMSVELGNNIDSFFIIPNQYKDTNGALPEHINILRDKTGKWQYNIGRLNNGSNENTYVAISDVTLINLLNISYKKYDVNSISITRDQIEFWIVSDRLIYSATILTDAQNKEIFMAEKLDEHWYHARFPYGQ